MHLNTSTLTRTRRRVCCSTSLPTVHLHLGNIGPCLPAFNHVLSMILRANSNRSSAGGMGPEVPARCSRLKMPAQPRCGYKLTLLTLSRVDAKLLFEQARPILAVDKTCNGIARLLDANKCNTACFESPACNDSGPVANHK